jgi:AraC family transcriptional regulator, transcriptional activator of pobA
LQLEFLFIGVFDMVQSVPTFSLYGDAHSDVAHEFVHIEEISARSAARNWQIDAHRHQGLFQLLFVFSGTARVLLDSEERDYASPLAVIIPPGVIHAFKFMPKTEGYVLTLDEAGLAGMAGAGDDAPQMFAALQSQAEVTQFGREGGALVKQVRGLLEQIAAEFANPGLASARMFVWLVRALLLLMVREQLARRGGDASEERHAGLFKRFRQLVEAHYREHWPVQRYAQELNLTENRLNRLCRREAGSTAFNLIQARLLLEARRKLVFTAMPVSQLAYELGFSDPAYFNRFFKKVAGTAPGAFREQASAGRDSQDLP